MKKLNKNELRATAKKVSAKLRKVVANERGDGAPGTIMGIAFAVIAIGVLVAAFRLGFPQMWDQVVSQFMNLF